MVYSDMCLFDLYDSVENGWKKKDGKKRVRKLVPVLSGPVWLCEYPRPKINKAVCVCVLFRRHSIKCFTILPLSVNDL